MATNRQGKIHIVEDNIDITGENYGGKLVDFTIEDNCYVNDKFIGTTVAKKITVNIINPNNEINLENKEIQAYAGINNELVPFGSFIIQKPDNQEVKEKTSFTGYDYMIKFNTPYTDKGTYPIKTNLLFQNLCEQVGLEVGNMDFTNCDYMILGNPFTNNEDCRTVLSNIAQLAGGFAHIGRDNKVYIVSLKNISNLLKVKDVHNMSVKELNLIPIYVSSGGKENSDEYLNGHNYLDDFSKNEQWGEVNSLIIRLSDIEGENTTKEDNNSINENGLTEITIADNYFLIDQAEREKVIGPLWNILKGIKYLPFKTSYYGYPYLDVGDIIYVEDMNDNGYISYVFNHTFTFNGAFTGSIETPALTKTQTAYKNTTDIKTKFKQAERRIDKINGIIQDLIQETSENTQKLSKHEQTIDSMKDTLKSQETKIETVESKADIAQSTADSATTKANNAQTSANNAQTTANTANTNAQNAQNKANENTTKITTTTAKLTEVEQTVDGITQSVSAVEEKVETVESTANTAQTTADTVNGKIDNLTVGGRNLLLNSKTLSGSNITGKGTISEETYNNFNIRTYDYSSATSGYQDMLSFNEIYPEKLGEVYVLSFYAKGSGKDKLGVYFHGSTGYVQTAKIEQSNGIINTNNGDGRSFWTLTDEWTKYWVIWTLKDTGDISIQKKVLFRVLYGGTASICGVKLEKGNKATDWTPAPEDIENNLTTNYYTKTETNSQIDQKADSITSSVSKTYATKTETANAKTEAINSANASTDEKLEDYTVTSKLGTFIEQNYEHVKIAWNQISEFIQMMIINNNASLAILDENKNVMMALDKTGQHFYKSDGKTIFGEMGVQTVDNNNYIAFSVESDYNTDTANGMAWGIKTKKDNKFHPILFIRNFNIGPENSDASFGELELNSSNLVLNGTGTGIKTGGVFINGDPTGFGLYFWDSNTNKSLLSIHPQNVVDDASIFILDNISFYRNQAGSNSFKIGDTSGSQYCLFTDEGSIHGSNLAISDGTNGVYISSNGEVSGNSLYFYALPTYQGNNLVYGERT